MLPAPDACAFAFAANRRTAKQRTSAQRLAGFMFQKREIARQEGLASASTGLPTCRNLYILSLLSFIFQASLKAAEAGSALSIYVQRHISMTTASFASYDNDVIAGIIKSILGEIQLSRAF
jgi:hypothetical protein